MTPRWFFIATVAALVCIGQPRAAHADAIFDIRVDTSSLQDPLKLYFQLTDGDAIAGNTAVILDGFAFGGGGIPDAGGMLDDLGTQVLIDSEFFTFVEQDFVPGTALSFRLTAKGATTPSETPDAFAFTLLSLDPVDGWLPIPTADLDAGTLLTIFFNSRPPTVLNFGTEDVPVTVTPVPEPGTLTLVGAALAAGIGRRLQRRRSAPRQGLAA